jgi:hypothetical protein
MCRRFDSGSAHVKANLAKVGLFSWVFIAGLPLQSEAFVAD